MITNIEIHKENASCLEYYNGCCIRIPVVYSSMFVTHLQYPQEEARSKAISCCRRQVTDCAVARRIERIKLVKT